MTEPPPNVESRGPDPRQPAYDAVYAYLTSTNRVPGDLVTRNAVAWRAVHAALDAILGHGGKTRFEWIDGQPEPGGLEQLRDEANQWRRKAVRRALGTAKLHGALNGCRDLVSEEVTRADGWGDGYREAIGDLREVLTAFDQLQPAGDGPTVAELAANDRNWDVEKGGE